MGKQVIEKYDDNGKLVERVTFLDDKIVWIEQPLPLPIENEWEQRARQIASCPCNPANGGSGVCGCTLSNPMITC